MQTPNGLTRAPDRLGAASRCFAPLAFVLVLSFGVNRLSRTTAQTLFWVFCAAMGASLTNIFLIYTGTVDRAGVLHHGRRPSRR